jgi:hypothetical protein
MRNLRRRKSGSTTWRTRRYSKTPPAILRWRFLERASLCLAIGVPAVATIGVAWFYSPSIIIQPAAALNPYNAIDAEFKVSNSGRLTVYNLLFQCEIIHETGTRFTVSGNIVHLPSGRIVEQGVAVLSPNESITRKCSFGAAPASPVAAVRYPASIITTAKYTWPLVRWAGFSIRQFNTRQDQRGGVALEPDF